MEEKMSLLERADRGTVAHLTLNSPENLNALSDAMIAELRSAFDALSADIDIRVIVLKGAGKAFCAGHDLKEMTAGRAAKDGGAEYFADLFTRCAAVMQAIPRLPQTVIAEVHGVATAAGCQLVASCDLALAAENARFGVNGVNIGLFCSTPMVALSRNVPRKQAFEMLSTGQFINAHRASEIGLINRAVPPESLAGETDALANLIAEKSFSALKIGKRAFHEQIEISLEAAYEHTGNAMVRNMLDRDAMEGISAFLEKRKPEWD